MLDRQRRHSDQRKKISPSILQRRRQRHVNNIPLRGSRRRQCWCYSRSIFFLKRCTFSVAPGWRVNMDTVKNSGEVLERKMRWTRHNRMIRGFFMIFSSNSNGEKSILRPSRTNIILYMRNRTLSLAKHLINAMCRQLRIKVVQTLKTPKSIFGK